MLNRRVKRVVCLSLASELNLELVEISIEKETADPSKVGTEGRGLKDGSTRTGKGATNWLRQKEIVLSSKSSGFLCCQLV
jgi:hypothetical protein